MPASTSFKDALREGVCKEVDNRRIYLCSPEYLTTYALRFVALGDCASSMKSSSTRFRSWPASGRWLVSATPSSCRTRCRAWRFPTSVMERMEAAGGREEQLQVGVEIAQESVRRVSDRIAGIQVSAPFGNVNTALAVIEGWEAG